MAAAAWYALVDGVRRLMQAGKILSLFTDAVFAFGLAAILTAFFLWGNYGQMRLFGFLGAACGYALMYFAVIQPLNAFFRAISAKIRPAAAKISQNRLLNIIFK